MKAVVIIIILLTSDFCRAQLDTNNKWEYYAELSKEANKEYPNSHYEIIDLDSLFNFIFSERNAQIKMDTSSNWKVLFEIRPNQVTVLVQSNIIRLIYLKAQYHLLTQIHQMFPKRN